ncbi:MAG: hypothetical protein K5694_02315 [Bacilli bacterium]|nr:hypothetical protein [Bacilli bacterium]
MAQTVRITIFTIAVIIVLFAFLALYLYNPIKSFVFRKSNTRFFYLKVNRLAHNEDYYLLNDAVFNRGKKGEIHINHILAGHNYIYVVTDVVYHGALEANSYKSEWNFIKKKNVVEKVPNPLLDNKAKIARITMSTGINSSFMIGIVLINNDCEINDFEKEEGDPLLVKAKNLRKTILSFEKRKNIKPFKEKELWQIIQDLNQLGCE